jgi:streptomycin 6-kinase
MNNFEKNITTLYGNKGKEWLCSLPEIVKIIAQEWNLSNLNPVANLSYNYVLTGLQEKNPIILKIGFDKESLRREAEALEIFRDYGAVKILDSMNNALLLQRLIPGTSLIDYFPRRDFAAVHIVCDVMKRLSCAPLPEGNRFPTIDNWLTALNRGEGIPMAYLVKARTLRDSLLKTIVELRLLHGDLHHYNILTHEKTFMVIDPKGVIGEPAYEVAMFIRNPIPDLLKIQEASSFVLGRIDEFSRTLHLSRQRIKEWSFVQGILAWIWALEDGGDPTYYKQLTEIFDQW